MLLQVSLLVTLRHNLVQVLLVNPQFSRLRIHLVSLLELPLVNPLANLQWSQRINRVLSPVDVRLCNLQAVLRCSLL